MSNRINLGGMTFKFRPPLKLTRENRGDIKEGEIDSEEAKHELIHAINSKFRQLHGLLRAFHNRLD